MDGGDGYEHASRCWTVHLKMVKMASCKLCIFYHNEKTVKKKSFLQKFC